MGPFSGPFFFDTEINMKASIALNIAIFVCTSLLPVLIYAQDYRFTQINLKTEAGVDLHFRNSAHTGRISELVAKCLGDLTTNVKLTSSDLESVLLDDRVRKGSVSIQYLDKQNSDLPLTQSVIFQRTPGVLPRPVLLLRVYQSSENTCRAASADQIRTELAVLKKETEMALQQYDRYKPVPEKSDLKSYLEELLD